MQIFGKKCVGKFLTFLKSGLLGGGWFGRTATDRKVPCPLGVRGNYGFYRKIFRESVFALNDSLGRDYHIFTPGFLCYTPNTPTLGNRHMPASKSACVIAK